MTCLISLLLIVAPLVSALFPATSIASQYQLASSTSLPFPTATLSSSDSASFIGSNWQVTKNGHVAQSEDISFATDPFDTNNTQPVLAVIYPAGSYSNGTGGTEFSTFFNDSSANGFQSMLLSYEVAFDPNFNWVKGGKLPGIRGGSLNDCSGGTYTTNCFSMRLMWRTNGAGEAYAYVPSLKSLCSDKDVRCNADGFGTSIGRGDFTFASGLWNTISLLVQLNDPPSKSNGVVKVYYNEVLVVQHSGLQIRSNSDVKGISGLFFSTFFGGNNASWATPTNQHTYYRNIQMWGSDAASNATSSALPTLSPSSMTGAAVALAVAGSMVFLPLF